jgi:tetratricopeptide (TPR) repeat protein
MLLGHVAELKACLPPKHKDLALAHEDLGKVSSSRGKLAEAKAAFSTALQIRRRAGHTKVIPDSLHALAKVAITRGEWDEAEALLTEELPLRREESCSCSRCYQKLSACLSLLGLATDRVGRGDDAIGFFKEAVQTCDFVRDSEEPRNAGLRLQCLVRLGSIMMDRGDFQAAELVHRRAVALMEVDDPDLPSAHLSAGTCLLEQGRFRDALLDFEEAKRIAKSIGDPEAHEEADEWLRTCRDRMHQRREDEKAAKKRQDEERALELRRKIAAIPENLRDKLIAELIDEDESPKTKKTFKRKGKK